MNNIFLSLLYVKHLWELSNYCIRLDQCQNECFEGPSINCFTWESGNMYMWQVIQNVSQISMHTSCYSVLDLLRFFKLELDCIISSCHLHPSIFMVIMTRPPSCTTPRQPTKNNDWRGLCCLGCIIDICFEIVVQYFDPVNEFWAKTASRAFNILFNCYT